MGWWSWTKWAVTYIVCACLLWAIYAHVIQTRFECVIFSVLALIYFELTIWVGALGVDSLTHRDHRNAALLRIFL